MVTINVDLSSVFFFMLGFLTCAGILIVLAIFYVIFPRISEAKRFFTFWLKIKDNEKKEKLKSQLSEE